MTALFNVNAMLKIPSDLTKEKLKEVINR